MPQIDEDFDYSEDQAPPLPTENLELLKTEPKNELLDVSDEDASELFNLALEQEELDYQEEYLDQKNLIKRPRRAKRQQSNSQSEIETNPIHEEGDCQCYYCGEMVPCKVIQNHMKSAHGRFHRKM